MSSTPTRRRLAPVVLATVMGALVLAGCGTGQGSATNYSEMEKAFIRGCEATRTSDADDSDAAALPDDFCQCAFDSLSDEDDGVPFEELKAINDDFVDDPGELPDDVTATFAACA